MHPVTLLVTAILSAQLSFSAALPFDHDYSGKWTSLPNIALYARQEHSVVATDPENVYIIGGIVPILDNVTSATVTFVQRYSIPHRTWYSVASLPLALNHPNSAVIDGRIYVIGGLSPDAEGTWRAVRNCYVYDPDSDTWEALPDIPDGRQTGAAAVGIRGATIYLSGGLSSILTTPGGAENTIGIVSSFDIVSSKWEILPDLPIPRDHAGSALIDNTIFVLGGRAFGHNNVVNTVFSLDLSCQELNWATNRATMPTARGGVASAVVDNKVIVFGGEGNPATGLGVTGTGVFDQVEAYDPKKDRWEKLAPMLHPRHGTMATAIGKTVYIPGGGYREGLGPVSTFDSFDFEG
jgi:N-acetylneuraminic acid mutarotase